MTDIRSVESVRTNNSDSSSIEVIKFLGCINSTNFEDFIYCKQEFINGTTKI